MFSVLKILLNKLFKQVCQFKDPKCKGYSGGGILACNCGKGETTVIQPPPPAPPPPAPSPGETSREAINAQIEAVPKILETQREFGPQFTGLTLEQLREFGPQFAQAGLDLSQQFGPQFAEQVRAEQEILAPERVAGSQATADFLNAGPDALSAEDEAFITERSRAARSSRGLAESGFSAQEELSNLFGARQALKDRHLNVALSASGRLPAAGSQTVNPAGASVAPGLIQNVTPANVFGAQASANALQGSIFKTQGGIFGSQSNFAAQQLANQPGSVFGQIAGGLAGGLAGGFGTGAGLSFFK